MQRGQPRTKTGSMVSAHLRGERTDHKIYIIAALLATVLLTAAGCSTAPRPAEVGLTQIVAEIIPQEGDATSYAIPLSLENTQQFIDYHSAISLTPEQEKVKRDALTALRAPCCDDNTMYNC
jgi:hypothetical protein